MKNIIELILKSLKDLPTTRIFLFLAIILVLVILYESYTGTFEYIRINKSIQLMKELQELEQSGILNNEHLKETYLEAVKRTSELLKEQSIILPDKVDKEKVSWWKKGLASSWIWLLCAICFLPGVLKGKTEKSFILGILIPAGAAWLIGMIIPPFWWPWFHAIILVIIQIMFVKGIIVKTKKK